MIVLFLQTWCTEVEQTEDNKNGKRKKDECASF